MERENVALKIEQGGVSPSTAFSWTSEHVPLQGMNFLVASEVIFTSECFGTHTADYWL